MKNANRTEFVRQNTEIEGWLKEKARKSKYTAKVYEFVSYHYFKWLRDQKNISNAKQLLDDYRRLKSENKEYEHIELAKEYIFSKLEKSSPAYREQVWRIIRSFYDHNYCSLPKKKIDWEITEFDEKRLREKQVLEVMRLEDVKKLIGPAKIRNKAIILILLQSGMRVGEFCDQFNIEPTIISSVLRHLNEGKCPIKIDLIASRRTRKTYFTFIGKDAIDALKEYLVIRGEIKTGEPIFISQKGKPVERQVIERQVKSSMKQTGLINKDFTPHTLRDIFKTECDHVGVKDSISEFFIGHALDALGYNVLDKLYPQDFEIEYARVEPTLNVLTYREPIMDEKTFARRHKVEIILGILKPPKEKEDELRKTLEQFDFSVEDAGKLRDKMTPELARELMQLAPQERSKRMYELITTEHNGGSQFESKIIDSTDEQQLLELISRGWEIVKELSNGKVVLRRGL